MATKSFHRKITDQCSGISVRQFLIFFTELNLSFIEHKFKLLSTETFDASGVFRSWADVLDMAMHDRTMACAECFSCSCSLNVS